jgi:hypothetical protein
MAGRVDSATHAAAIAKIAELARHAPELRAHLDEIVNGVAFKGSPRAQEFLKYVVDRGLRGEFEELRERSIGVALFNKPVAYDTAEDAVVRVTASDVRKRLLQHYGKPGAAAMFRIDLPPGSYVPEFRRLTPDAAAPAEVASVEKTAAAKVEPAPPVPEPQLSARRAFPWRAVAIAALVTQCATAVWWMAAGRQSGIAPSANFVSTAFRGAPGALQVIVGDDGLLLIEVLLNRRFTLQEYENLAYLATPDLVQKKALQAFWDSLSTRPLTNLGNLHNAARVAESMRNHKWNVSIRHARQVNPRDFRSGNFLILGSSHANPWAALFQAHNSNFSFESAPPGKWAVIRNRRPVGDEPATFEVHADPATGKTLTFAQVSLVENDSRTGRVLLVAGQSTSATELAGEFLLRSDSVGKALRMLKLPEAGPLPDLEMILRISEVNEVGDSVGLVACRKLAKQAD